MKVNILGRQYEVIVKKYDDDPAFARDGISGWCDTVTKELVVCDMATYKGYENEPPHTIEDVQKETTRHEIVHAFLYESGLHTNTLNVEEWATNEEMVDWISIQGPKIYKAWEEADAL